MISPDTIVAVATPHGFGGISVVRLSGSSSKDVVCSISVSSSKRALTFIHRAITLVKLKDENNNIFEDALIAFFKAPGSYTGEDLFEISCHGNPSIVNKIVSICCLNGARLAEPGEFTKRSFLNGKIDLIQAEAVATLIHSKTEESASLNFKMLSGELSLVIKNLKRDLITLLSKIEFELDISEEDLQPGLQKNSRSILKNCKRLIKKALSSHNAYRVLNKGASVVLCGPPNVGKSTLLNFLSGSNLAITSPRPGTTRDAIEGSVSISGLPVTLTDTAGLRSSDDEIESEGVIRAKEKIASADCAVYLTDVDNISKSSPKGLGKRPVFVVNKSDLINNKKLSLLKKRHPHHSFVSAKTGYGIELLLGSIKNEILPSPSLSSSVPIVTERQKNIMLKIQDHVQSALLLLSPKENIHYDLVSVELRDALRQLDSVLGKTATDDILDQVFNSFCVGK